MAEREKLSKEYSDKGWQLSHAQPARTANDSPTGAAEAGNFIALKRDPNSQGDSPIEMAASSREDLEAMIADWERSRPVNPDEAPQPDEQALRNSAEATLHMSVTAGARPAVDLDLTPAAKKAKPKAIRLAAKPAVEEIKLDEQTQAGIAEGPGTTTTGKTTGVGDGTTSGAASAGAGSSSGSKSSSSSSSSSSGSKK